MRTRSYAAGLAGLALITAVTGGAQALNKRAEAVQQGDFVLLGNTLAQDCGAATPQPIAGTLDCVGAGNANDLAPDVFWHAEAGAASASAAVTVDQAQSAATLKLPPGAEITHAYLYWAAQNFGVSDNNVTIQCLDQAGAPHDAQALSNWLSFSGAYSAVADVKDFIQMYGACTYLVGGVSSAPLGSMQAQSFGYALWWMVVLYKDPSAPHRQLTLLDGLDTIGNGGDSQPQFTGFLIPNGFDLYSKANIGVVAYDGDAGLSGDKLLLGDVLLKDSGGNENNFFNSSRTYLDAALSITGDLPQLSGAPGSMNRLDLDTIDVTSLLTAGQSQIDMKAFSDGEFFELAGLVLSVPTFTDEDGDTLSDDEELLLGTDPADKDTDDDGVADGQEGCSDLASCPDPAWKVDSDGDGLINALDPDSDNDGLLDGTELGLDCMAQDTQASKGRCTADADEGKTKTDPLNPDSDAGGAYDGSEDANLNGLLDPGETDPTALGADDDASVKDADTDGLSDALEAFLGSSSSDADTDDDGLLDGLEANPTCDTDGDGLTNTLDVDSDNDTLYDGTEAGKDCMNPATAKGAVAHCIADTDPATVTSPVSNDSDRGGALDGSEDWNRDGAVGAGETDPTLDHKGDDAMVKDTDSDGLGDDLETALGSGVDDKDSDDDGAMDSLEANPGDDMDGDSAVNVKDPDSDGDGLFDGTERGNGCADPSTNNDANHCLKDGDTGKTKTCMVDADTDNGGVSDGTEDFNKDGVYDAEAGEGDPNDKSDDMNIMPCMTDADCGPADSGNVCDDAAKHCIAGCRSVDGSRCPTGEVCSSEDSTIGYCIDASGPGPGVGGGGGAGGAGSGGGTGGGRNCNCVVQPSDPRGDLAWLLAISAGALCMLRRRRR